MSAFVLKREYTLQLPNRYVEVDRDEMEYVDGGHWEGCYGNTYWWGAAVQFSAHGAADMAAILAGGAALATIAAIIGPFVGLGVTATAVVGISAGVLALGASAFWYASNHNGMYVEYNYTTKFKSSVTY